MEVNRKPKADHLIPFKIDEYIDGETPPERTQCFEQHLASCHDCRELFQQRQMFLISLDNAFSEPFLLPPDFTFREYRRRDLSHVDLVTGASVAAAFLILLNGILLSSRFEIVGSSLLSTGVTEIGILVNVLLFWAMFSVYWSAGYAVPFTFFLFFTMVCGFVFNVRRNSRLNAN